MKYFLKIKGYNRRIKTTYNIKGRTLKKLFRIVKNKSKPNRTFEIITCRY